MLIGVAGPAANFVLAFVLMVFYFGWINEVPAVEVTTTTSSGLRPAPPPPRPAFSPATSSATSTPSTIPTWERSSMRRRN